MAYARPGRIRIFVLTGITSYLIIIKSLMPSVVLALYHDLTSPDVNPPPWMLSGQNWISIIMIPLIPLTFLRKLDSLRHTSYVALFSVGEPQIIERVREPTKWILTAYLVLIVIVCYFFPLEGTQKPGEIHLIKFSSGFVSTFPVQVFAYTCAQNVSEDVVYPRRY